MSKYEKLITAREPEYDKSFWNYARGNVKDPHSVRVPTAGIQQARAAYAPALGQRPPRIGQPIVLLFSS